MERSSSANDLHKLWWLLLQARRSTYRVRQKELARYNITPEEAAVLFVIKAIGRGATPAEISRWLLREPQSALGLVNRMAKKGLVSKFKDLDRRNLTRVAITEKGEQAYSQATDIESICRIMSVLSEQECQQLRVFLEKLRDKALEDLGITKKPEIPLS